MVICKACRLGNIACFHSSSSFYLISHRFIYSSIFHQKVQPDFKVSRKLRNEFPPGVDKPGELWYDRIIIYVAEKFAFIGSLMEFVSPNTLFQGLIPIGLTLGVGIGFFGSVWTIRKHLKV